MILAVPPPVIERSVTVNVIGERLLLTYDANIGALSACSDRELCPCIVLPISVPFTTIELSHCPQLFVLPAINRVATKVTLIKLFVLTGV